MNEVSRIIATKKKTVENVSFVAETTSSKKIYLVRRCEKFNYAVSKYSSIGNIHVVIWLIVAKMIHVFVPRRS